MKDIYIEKEREISVIADVDAYWYAAADLRASARRYGLHGWAFPLWLWKCSIAWAVWQRRE